MSDTALFSLIFLASVFISSVSQVLLKKSANKVHTSIIKEYLNVPVLVAYAMFFASTLITVFAYKKVPLMLGPVLEAAGYVFVAVLSFLVLKEKFKRKQLLGMILILVGIVIVTLGGKNGI